MPGLLCRIAFGMHPEPWNALSLWFQVSGPFSTHGCSLHPAERIMYQMTSNALVEDGQRLTTQHHHGWTAGAWQRELGCTADAGEGLPGI